MVELGHDPKCAYVQSHRAHPQAMSAELGKKSHLGRGGGQGGDDFLKEVVFEFSCPGWVCFYRCSRPEHGGAGKGSKVSKRADTSGGEVKSVFEGTVNREAGFARRFQSRRKGQEKPKGPCHTHTSTS